MMVLQQSYGLVAGRQDIRDLHVRLCVGLVRTAGISARGVLDFLRVSSQDGLERWPVLGFAARILFVREEQTHSDRQTTKTFG